MAWENVHSTVWLTVAIISPVGYANFCTHFTILKNAKNIADKRQFPTVAKRKNPIEQNICMHMYVCVCIAKRHVYACAARLGALR